VTDVSQTAHAPSEPPKVSGTPFESVVLLLQGGGALGSYQAGVYQAVCEHGIEPTWISGISIGAINSAIIAGNPVEKRVEKLREFWETVSTGDSPWSNYLGDLYSGDFVRGLANQISAGGVLLRGVPAFFAPRYPPAPLQPKGTPEATSWYDTSPLRGTLERLVDFDRINSGEMRFSIGAVNVRTGNFAYFDNATEKIRPAHVMASGALPPAFPAVEVDGQFYWDGGMVSNTPLDWVLSTKTDLDTLVLQVDLWSARGHLPKDMSEVAVRMKEIQYSSRTRAATDEFRRVQKLRAAFNELLAKMPPELAATPQAQLLARQSDPAVYNIVQLIYRSPTYESQSKDYEFSRATMEEHWKSGYQDALTTLSHPEVLKLPDTPSMVKVFDVLRPSDEEEHPAKADKITK
jgi:NTE family protein